MPKRATAEETPASKRASLASIRYKLPFVSQSALAAICEYANTHGLPNIHDPREVRKARDQASIGIMTPYGNLLQDHEFFLGDGESITHVEMINPWAQMYHMAATCQAFSELLEWVLEQHGPCTPDRPLHVMMYTDEVTPGNQLAHKHARKVQALYYSLKEFQQFLGQEELWVTGTILATSTVSTLQGGWSSVVARFAKEFFNHGNPGRDMSRAGINIRLFSGKRVHLFFTFGDFVSDELAMSTQVYESMGANGLKCCKWCANVFNSATTRAGARSDPWSVLHTSHEIHRFTLHTASTLRLIVDRLRTAQAAMGPGELKELQTRLGFKFAPHSILFDEHLFPLMELAGHAIADWMHVFFVGGIVQKELGLFMYEMRRTGLTYAAAHEYAQQFRWPKAFRNQTGVGCLSPEHAHTALESRSFKATASEARSVLPVLAFFVQNALQRDNNWSNRQRDMAKCIIHLFCIVQELEAAGQGLCNADRMEMNLIAHMELYVKWG